MNINAIPSVCSYDLQLRHHNPFLRILHQLPRIACRMAYIRDQIPSMIHRTPIRPDNRHTPRYRLHLRRVPASVKSVRQLYLTLRRMVRQQHGQLHLRMPRFRFCYSPCCHKIKISVMSYNEFGHTVLYDMFFHCPEQNGINAVRRVSVADEKADIFTHFDTITSFGLIITQKS